MQAERLKLHPKNLRTPGETSPPSERTTQEKRVHLQDPRERKRKTASIESESRLQREVVNGERERKDEAVCIQKT